MENLKMSPVSKFEKILAISLMFIISSLVVMIMAFGFSYLA